MRCPKAGETRERIRDAHVDMVITTTGGYAGGLVGWVRNSTVTIERSSARGTLDSGNDYAGGLVGSNDGRIAFSSAAVTITSTGDQVGGLVGYNEGDINDAVARGSVTGADEVGGLIGLHHDGTVERTFATGAVSATGGNAGGLIGFASTTFGVRPVVEDSYWDTQTTGQTSDAQEGTGQALGRTTAQMRTLTTFSDEAWDIVAGWQPFAPPSRVWGICSGVNDGYPFLLWTATSDPCGTGGSSSGAPPATPVLTAGTLPSVPAGQGAWRRADDTSVPLDVSSPGPGRIRYRTDGVRVTFTGGVTTGTTTGLVANAAGEIVCEVCFDLRAGEVIEVWMLSRPRLVAARLIDAAPCQTFAIPLGAPLDGGGPIEVGTHTLQLALPTAVGMQAINVGVTVAGAVPTRVAAGEGAHDAPWWRTG